MECHGQFHKPESSRRELARSLAHFRRNSLSKEPKERAAKLNNLNNAVKGL